MKQNKIKKGLSLILTFALVIGLLPVMPGNANVVKAAGGSAPSITAYATKDELMNWAYDTTVGKIVFGKDSSGNPMEWYILGSDSGVAGDNTVIFAASPIVSGVRFEKDINNAKAYQEGFGTYLSNAPTEVFPNHYGASDLRATLNEMASSNSYFTGTEQSLLQNTTVTTTDTMNMTSYTTTDVLYALYSERDNTTLYAGSDNGKALAMSTYWNTGDWFWLRAPDDDNYDIALVADTGFSVNANSVFGHNGVQPVSNLNLSSVLFASSAKASTSGVTSENITSGEAMSLRLAGTSQSVGSVYVDNTDGLILADIGSGATGTVSLVVQGNDGTNDWYYSKVITSKELIETSDIEATLGISDISLSNCQVWVETTSGGVIYANQATASDVITMTAVAVTIDEPEAEVELALTGETATSGVASTSPSISWTPEGLDGGVADYDTAYTASFTLEETDESLFMSGVTATVNGESATVTENGDGTITVSYTFPATIKQGTGTLSIENSRFGEDYAVQPESDTNDATIFTAEYKVKDASDDTYTDVKPTAIGDYTARVILPANTEYSQAILTADFSILKPFGDVTFSIDNIKYGGTLVPQIASETNDEESAVIEYKIAAAVEDAYSTVVPTAVGSYTARVTLPANESYEEVVKTTSFSILKAEGTGTFSIADIYYGGTVSPQVASQTNDASAAFYEYKLAGVEDSTYSSTVPTAVGSYTARVTIPENESYNSVVLTDGFTISYLPAPDSDIGVSGTSGTNKYYTSPVTVEPPEGYLISDTLDGEYSTSLVLSESREAGYFYLLNIETGEKTAGIWSDGFLIDIVAPSIDAVEGKTYYSEFKEVTIEDKNLSKITINGEEFKDFKGSMAKIKLSSENGVKVYEIVITDLAGNEKELKFIVASEWVKKGVVPTGESVSLISDYEYKLGEGSWQLEGDATSYNGNISFYVVEEGEYVFSQQ